MKEQGRTPRIPESEEDEDEILEIRVQRILLTIAVVILATTIGGYYTAYYNIFNDDNNDQTAWYVNNVLNGRHEPVRGDEVFSGGVVGIKNNHTIIAKNRITYGTPLYVFPAQTYLDKPVLRTEVGEKPVYAFQCEEVDNAKQLDIPALHQVCFINEEEFMPDN